MRRAVTTWLVSGFLALTATAWAQQTTPPAGEEQETTTTMEGHSTVAREDVRTWTIDVDDRTWATHGGGGHGFSTMLCVRPGEGAAVVLLTNVGGQSLEGAALDLVRAVQRRVG